MKKKRKQVVTLANGAKVALQEVLEKREVISLTLTKGEKDWIDSRGEPRGRYFSRLIDRDRSTVQSPDLAAGTSALRACLDIIDEACAEADEALDEIETAAGLVSRTGKRIDD